jgi:tetratricopeptide (TPR) repeat protein
MILFHQNRNEEAAECFRRSHVLADRTGHMRALPALLLNLGCVAVAQARFGEAEEYLQSSLAHAEAMKGKYDAAMARANMASLRLEQGRYQEAVSLATDADKVFDALGTIPRQVFCNAIAGHAARAMGDLELSGILYKRAINMAEGSDLQSDALAEAYEGVAAILETSGDLLETRAVLDRARQIFESLGAAGRAGQAFAKYRAEALPDKGNKPEKRG